MARKPISQETLEELGAARLAALVLAACERDAAFKRRVTAALAMGSGSSGDGAVAVAKLIDRRLAGLERARGFVDWNTARAFRADLAALVASIVGDLGAVDPEAACERLIRGRARRSDRCGRGGRPCPAFPGASWLG